MADRGRAQRDVGVRWYGCAGDVRGDLGAVGLRRGDGKVLGIHLARKFNLEKSTTETNNASPATASQPWPPPPRSSARR